jgi:hypothetical protein
MKNLALFLVITGFVYFASCTKDSQSDAFKLLTGSVWESDSLLANRQDASSPGGLLEDFKGEYKFNEDGSGNFGNYTGIWSFAYNETNLKITSASLNQGIPMTTTIAELTKISLKITASYPNVLNLAAPINIRMTFKAK